MQSCKLRPLSIVVKQSPLSFLHLIILRYGFLTYVLCKKKANDFLVIFPCRSILLPERRNDYVNNEGYSNWPFMSVHYWGEDPAGDWQIKVYFSSQEGAVSAEDLAVVLYGTSEIPDSVVQIPEQCSSQCLRGCAAQGEEFCDSCKNRRIKSNLRCVTSCPEAVRDGDRNTSLKSDSCSVGGYCFDCQKRSLPLSIPIIVFIVVSGMVLLVGSMSVTYVLWTKLCENHSDYISI